MNKKFFIETYGCQMNTAESAALEAHLADLGWSAAGHDREADLIIINTCSVRKTAENRIWGRLGYFKRLKNEHDFTLIVIGCMAERLKEGIKKVFPVVDGVISNFKKDRIAELINAGKDKNSVIETLEEISAYAAGIDETYTFFDRHGRVSRTHAMIPVMNGCDNFCSYCIVPYVRGREISRNIDEIIKEINTLGRDNVSEITLLGQNVNSYRWVPPAGKTCDFSDLLKRIISETDARWIRFTSSNPQDFSEKLMNIIASESRICGSIHLPAQHGSDRILKKMNRKYSSSEYTELALKLRNLDRDISLTTDLMVGFPGETEADFIELRNLMTTIRFEEAFTYFYNPREGTAAFEFEDDVPIEIKKQRLSEIIALQQRITSDEKKLRLGTTVEAVIECPSKKDPNEILARTERNNMVVFPGRIETLEDYVKIRLVGLRGNTYTGEAIS